MGEKFSIVVICKNEADVIVQLLESVQHITDDVVIYDNGSTDNTEAVVSTYKNVQWHKGTWDGFGKTKHKATLLAKHNWVLSLDADEAPDETLQQQLQQLDLSNEKVAYNIRFKNMLGNKHLHWGEWGSDSHVRLFNKKLINWNDAPVHEELVIPNDVQIQKLKGSIIHRTIKDLTEYGNKMVKYALMNAEKYYAKGKRSTWVKRHISPRFTFLKYYVLMLGFLDGWEGLVCARMTAFYTFLKYARLYELQKKN
jgi:glycosyltransferase involved in cell wall biosynthesis